MMRLFEAALRKGVETKGKFKYSVNQMKYIAMPMKCYQWPNIGFGVIRSQSQRKADNKVLFRASRDADSSRTKQLTHSSHNSFPV